MNIEIKKADYFDSKHKMDIPILLDAYASDPMGGGVPLKEEVHENLVEELSKLAHAFSIIAYVDNEAAGLINCFRAFSTFSCKPLVNIHDCIVLEKHRGLGLSQRMLDKVAEIAKEDGCCKLTLEVLSNNEIAKKAYNKFGFDSYELDPKAGAALFLQKKL